MATKKGSKSQQEQDAAKANAHLLRPKGEPRPTPKDYAISLAAKGGTDRQLLHPPTERVQRQSTIGNMGNLSTAKMLFHSKTILVVD